MYSDIVEAAKFIADEMNRSSVAFELIQNDITEAKSLKQKSIQEKEDAEKQFAIFKDKSSKEIQEILVRIGTLQDEKEKHRQEVDALVKKKSELKVENASLESKNKEFIVYEKRAKAALENANKVLIEKSRQMDADQILLNNRRTFLPS